MRKWRRLGLDTKMYFHRSANASAAPLAPTSTARHSPADFVVFGQRLFASSSSNNNNITTPTRSNLKSWESGARRVKNVNGEDNTYLDHIRDLHDPSQHVKTIEDELKGTIGKALGKQGEKILAALRLMDQERRRYYELIEMHHQEENSSSQNNNDSNGEDDDEKMMIVTTEAILDHPEIRQCAERHNRYREDCLHKRWELIVHRQAVGFIVGNHQFVMEKFPIPDELPFSSRNVA